MKFLNINLVRQKKCSIFVADKVGYFYLAQINILKIYDYGNKEN